MKEKVLSFLKPRIWTVLFTVMLVLWQYVYAYRGIDFESISSVRSYFGFGFSAVNWNNFLIRTFSMGLIWLVVAILIFLVLWALESIVIGSHNRKIRRQYVNRPPEDFEHLLKDAQVSFRTHFAGNLWLSAFIVLIPIGFFLLSGIVESLRVNAVTNYLISAQESGTEIDFFNPTVMIVSFLATLPVWYLYSCLDSFCLKNGRKEKESEKIADEHFATNVVEFPPDTEEDEEDDSDESKSSSLPPAPVI